MARINDTTTYPITTPVSNDILIGTDISNTTNSANGETVNFTAGSVADLAFTTGWHPYNKLTVGDTNDGLIYSFAVDGAVAEIETPDFELGYEYAVFFDGLEGDATSSTTLQIEMFRAGNSYASAEDISSSYNKTDTFRGILYLPFSGVEDFPKGWTWLSHNGNGSNGINYNRSVMTKVKFSWADGEDTRAGDLYLWRRREFITG